MVQTVLLCTKTFAACIGHFCILHPALPAPEHKIPGVEKPVTSALVPILGGPFAIDWVWPQPGRPAAQMLTVCLYCGLRSSITLRGHSTHETRACDPSHYIVRASEPAQQVSAESAYALQSSVRAPPSSDSATNLACTGIRMPRPPKRSKRVARVAVPRYTGSRPGEMRRSSSDQRTSSATVLGQLV